MLATELRVLIRGMADSWRHHRTLLLAVWLVTLAACILAATAGGMYHFHDFQAGEGGRWAGLFTVLSAGCLSWAGFALLLVARRRFHRHRRDPATAAWTLAGAGGVFLALDELLQLHETIARRLAAWGVPAPFGIGDHDLYVFGGYALCALWVGNTIRPDLLRWNRAALPAVAGTLCFLVSGAVDMMPWETLSRAQQDLWGPIEEIAKTLGAVNLALFGVLLHEAAADEDRLPPD